MGFKFLKKNNTPITEEQREVSLNQTLWHPISVMSHNRFIVTFPGRLSNLTNIVESINLPSVINRRWSNFSITFYETRDFPLLSILSNMDRTEELVGNGIDIKVEILSPDSQVLGVWEMINCVITEVDFGKLSYSDMGVYRVIVTFTPFSCEFISQ